MGCSLLDFHNDRSIQLIVETLKILKGGEGERLITDGDERRIYLRAVRGEDGRLDLEKGGQRE